MIVVYCHGYGSSANTSKVNRLREAGIETYAWNIDIDPDVSLPYLEDRVFDTLLNNINLEAELVIVGTSLGGWYAAELSERFACRGILINPSFDPGRSLAKYGVPEDILSRYYPLSFTKDHTVYIGSNDTVIDFTDAEFGDATVHRVEGADHRFNEHFDLVINQLLSECRESMT